MQRPGAERGSPHRRCGLEKREEVSNACISHLLRRPHARTAREEGQALVEYALILGLVSVVAIALLSAVGTDITSLLARVTSALASAL